MRSLNDGPELNKSCSKVPGQGIFHSGSRRINEDKKGLNPARNAIVCILCMLPISMLVQSFPGFDSINIILICALLFFMVLHLAKATIAHGFWLLVCGTFFITIYEFFITKASLYEPSTPAYLLLWVVFLTYVAYLGDELCESLRDNVVCIKNSLIIWNALVLVSVFLPSSYSGGWGDGLFFTSFTDNVFRLEQAAFCIVVLDTIYLTITRNRKMAFTLIVLPLYCAFMGGSRTYFAIISVAFLVFLAEWGWSRRKYATICCMVLLCTIVIAMNTSIGDKFLAQLQPSSLGYDLLHQFTNGRSEFWSIDLSYYFDLPLIGQLFGSGYNCIYDINRLYYGVAIYAHNDFINLLVTYGAFGLMLYLIPILFLIRIIFKKRGFALAAAFSTVWFVNAFFNMNYTYTCATIALGLLFTFSCGSKKFALRISEKGSSQKSFK